MQRADEPAFAAAQPARPALSGRYRSSGDRYEVVLRVDVDGERPSQRLSADISKVRGATRTFAGSFVVADPELISEEGATTLRGWGDFTWNTRTRFVEVRIANAARQDEARAQLSRFDDQGRPGPSYDCRRESAALRSVKLTEDHERGVEKFTTYDPTSLVSGGAGRELSIVKAYAEASIELAPSGASAELNTAAAGLDASWNDAELHNAMQSRLGTRDRPEWSLWMIHAGKHDRGLAGWMFDLLDDRQRQGCAVFYSGIGAGLDPPERRREQLFTCAHEIGHTFNLRHCWEQSHAGPPRPSTLSWMNYPDLYPDRGREGFWEAFPFLFDADELRHLRHGFRNDVIMGGAPFRPAPDEVLDTWPRPAGTSETGLSLRIAAPPEAQYGVPVTAELALSATTDHVHAVPRVLGPRAGTVDVFIRRPDGTTFAFEPLLSHCRRDEPASLQAGSGPIRDHAFLHYGKQGFAFEEPGVYELRARYQHADGSVVLSEAVQTHVQEPLGSGDRAAKALLYNHQQGVLMSLAGSSSPSLKAGNDGLREFAERHPEHPAAAVARVVIGNGAARDFKTIAADGAVKLQRADVEAAQCLLGGVFEFSRLRGPANASIGMAAETPAAKLRRIGTKRGVIPAVDSFIASRRHEIGAEVAGLQQAGTASERQTR